MPITSSDDVRSELIEQRFEYAEKVVEESKYSKPILFLDHDGVMCLATDSEHYSWRGKLYRFNAKAVKVLNEIISLTDCNIVVTSDWRHNVTLEELQDYYKDMGVIKSPVAVTGFEPSSLSQKEYARCVEINKFIEEHEVERYCVVDDMRLEFVHNFVWTWKATEGIKQTNAKYQIVNYLKEVAPVYEDVVEDTLAKIFDEIEEIIDKGIA